MSFTDILLFLHIFGFGIWFGAGITVGFLNLKTSKTRNLEKINDSANSIEWLANRLFKPASLLTLISGVWMVILAKWVGFLDFWIIFSLVLVVATFFLGGVLIPKLVKQISQAKNNGDTQKVLNTHYKLIFVSHLDSIAILLVVFDMIVKPKIYEISFWIPVLIFLLVSVGLSYLRLKKNIVK